MTVAASSRRDASRVSDFGGGSMTHSGEGEGEGGVMPTSHSLRKVLRELAPPHSHTFLRVFFITNERLIHHNVAKAGFNFSLTTSMQCI